MMQRYDIHPEQGPWLSKQGDFVTFTDHQAELAKVVKDLAEELKERDEEIHSKYLCIDTLRGVVKEKDEEIAKLRDTRDQLATQLNVHAQENAKLQSDLDQVVGEAVQFAKACAYGCMTLAVMNRSTEFLASPHVQARRAGQGDKSCGS